MPDANRHLKRWAVLYRGKMVESRLVELQRSVRRHVAESANLFTILVKLVVRKNGRQKDGQRHCGRRRLYGESIPCEAVQVAIALFCPGFVGAEKRPRGVVEIRRRPAGVVAGMEAPLSIQRNDGLAVRDEREGSGMRGGRIDLRIGEACWLGEG